MQLRFEGNQEGRCRRLADNRLAYPSPHRQGTHAVEGLSSVLINSRLTANPAVSVTASSDDHGWPAGSQPSRLFNLNSDHCRLPSVAPSSHVVPSRKVRGGQTSTDPYRGSTKSRVLPVIRIASPAAAVARYTSSSGSRRPNATFAGSTKTANRSISPMTNSKVSRYGAWLRRPATASYSCKIGSDNTIWCRRTTLSTTSRQAPSVLAADTKTLQSKTTLMARRGGVHGAIRLFRLSHPS